MIGPNIHRPERMSIRYDEEARKASGFAESTYATIFEQLEKEGSEVRLGSSLVP